jgi:hypothetical protein
MHDKYYNLGLVAHIDKMNKNKIIYYFYFHDIL